MDNKNNNQTNPPSDYQDILNKYSSSVKPDTNNEGTKTPSDNNPTTVTNETNVEDPEIKMSEIVETPPSLKDFNSTPIDTPTPVSLSDNLESSKSFTEESSSVVENEPELTPESEVKLNPEPQSEPKIELIPEPVSEFESQLQSESQPETEPELKNPEEIKQKIEEVLSYNTASDNETVVSQSNKPKSSGVLKTLFFISLFIFIGVVGVLGYFITNPVSKTNPDSKTTVNPTTVPTQTGVTCELNGFIYTQGQSFPSADGCNTCSCDPSGEIVCTEKACDSATTITPATKSAAKITIIPTKSNTIPALKTSITPAATSSSFIED